MLPHYSLAAHRPDPSGPQVSGGHSNGHPGTRMSVSHTTETTVTDGGFKYYEVTKHQKSKDTSLQRGICSSPALMREISTQGPGTFQMYDEKALGKISGSETSYKRRKKRKKKARPLRFDSFLLRPDSTEGFSRRIFLFLMCVFPTRNSTGKPILACSVNINRAKEQPTWKDTKGCSTGPFLVVQWLRIHLEMQGMWVRALVQELRSHTPQSD